MNATTNNTTKSNRTTTNFLLGAVAALLLLNLAAGVFGIKFPPETMAQSGGKGNEVIDPPFNAGLQRKNMIDAINQLGEKVSRLESRLEKPLNVKVLEMPAVTVRNPETK